jgi:hypothetical protein
MFTVTIAFIRLKVYIILGVDDAESECGLDKGIDWDIVIQNDNDEQVFNTQVEQIEKHVNEMMNR